MTSKIALISAAAAALAAAALTAAGPAQASSVSGNNGADVVSTLRSEGYNVQVDGAPSAPLSACTVTDVHGLPNAADPTQRADTRMINNVYVDVTCASDS
ncbi:hypothetical protein [Mycolicibacterium llatzerense]|uniref:PASTA domain-containing protein n=1 Tax=Mycolicibacterium llatzerense TaxID=280871 RepID=A0A0D1LCU8_9MYCO|nr:hypothetical protein [Mycolicibacterium llatzerense]KIU18600.1 hypothetical protein TL10_01895 [Mycolicibacterium llatzerense]MCT7369373.1 hypothetical protein [Mycolicibacterium llatzerense]